MSTKDRDGDDARSRIPDRVAMRLKLRRTLSALEERVETVELELAVLALADQLPRWGQSK